MAALLNTPHIIDGLVPDTTHSVWEPDRQADAFMAKKA